MHCLFLRVEPSNARTLACDHAHEPWGRAFRPVIDLLRITAHRLARLIRTRVFTASIVVMVPPPAYPTPWWVS
ncbi:BQ5605_C005g03647 [Microbotryum silenes-dioicae]|uniref:BQ5605_C005g03647 protein n=1 Tax=Microbotryum silenes-dioicae TaxID=796604 RepID=A0A2X0PDJ4_9BASI|nr:BQ5605_C005g03647 [Microbotryum silenes-dioicae]